MFIEVLNNIAGYTPPLTKGNEWMEQIVYRLCNCQWLPCPLAIRAFGLDGKSKLC